MKYLKILFLLFAANLNAQVEVPHICYVSVENNRSVVRWSFPDTSAIDGFIVKRVIVDGQGVVNGTLNNIAILSNTALSFVDTSTAYNTTAKPFARSEKYTVAAFKNEGGQISFSAFEFVHSTIFLQGRWEVCSHSLTLNWTSYKNRAVEKYVLMYSFDGNSFSELTETLDTTLVISNLESNRKYFVRVAAILQAENTCNQDTSMSNVINFYSGQYVPPQLTPLFATVDAQKIKVVFAEQGGNGVARRVVVHYPENDTLNELAYANGRVSVSYDFADRAEGFRLITFDSCGILNASSEMVRNMYLTGKQDNGRVAVLFNRTSLAGEKPDGYKLWLKTGDGWQIFSELADTSIVLHYRDLFATGEPQDGRFSLRIEAYNDSLNSFSNVLDLPLEPVLSVPNAINPYSANETDRYFRVSVKFATDVELQIYTEKGVKVFSTDDLQIMWDGRLSGKLLPAGMYVYHLDYKSVTGERFKKNGAVYLVY